MTLEWFEDDGAKVISDPSGFTTEDTIYFKFCLHPQTPSKFIVSTERQADGNQNMFVFLLHTKHAFSLKGWFFSLWLEYFLVLHTNIRWRSTTNKQFNLIYVYLKQWILCFLKISMVLMYDFMMYDWWFSESAYPLPPP